MYGVETKWVRGSGNEATTTDGFFSQELLHEDTVMKMGYKRHPLADLLLFSSSLLLKPKSLLLVPVEYKVSER